MWWKIYFWINLVITVIGYLFLLPQIALFNLASWEGTLESIPIVLAAYSYAYKKHLFPSNVWKGFFVFLSIIWVAQLIYYSNLLPTLKPLFKFLEAYPLHEFNGVLFSVLFSSPALYAMYKLGYPPAKSKKTR